MTSRFNKPGAAPAISNAACNLPPGDAPLFRAHDVRGTRTKYAVRWVTIRVPGRHHQGSSPCYKSIPVHGLKGRSSTGFFALKREDHHVSKDH